MTLLGQTRGEHENTEKEILFVKLDNLARIKCKERDGWRCRRCGATWNLEWSHIMVRKYLNTRWDLKNCFTLCDKCHEWWHANPIESAEWAKILMGEDLYYENMRRAHEPPAMSIENMQRLYEHLKSLTFKNGSRRLPETG